MVRFVRWIPVFLAIALAATAHAQPQATPLPMARVVSLKPAPAPSFRIEDQFEKAYQLNGFTGDILVLIYGDRESADQNRALGETLHLSFHPQARNLSPSQARKAPPLAMADLPAGMRCPDVHAVPVAVIGRVPGLVKNILRGEFKKASPDCPIWLDCEDSMRQSFGMAQGVPNLVIIDAKSQVRMAAGGRLEREHVQELVNGIEALRREAAGLR